MAEQKAKVVKVGRGGPRGPRPKVQNPGKIFMRILRYVMECYRIQVVAVVICIFVSVFANVQGTLFMQTLIDGYILPLLKEQSSDFSGLAHAIARTAGFYGIGIVTAFAQARMMAYVTQGTLKRLRDEMFTHMQTLPIKYFDRNAHGDIMSLYTNDIDTLRQMISQSMPQLLNSAITVVSVLVSMVVLSVPLTVLTLVMVGIMLLVTKYLTTNSSKYFVSQQRDIGAVNGYIEEMMNGQKVVKVFCHEEEAIEQFDKLNDQLFESADKANRYSNLGGPANTQLGNLSYVFCAMIGGALALSGMTGLTLGKLASFLTFNRTLNMPISQISMQFNAIIMALAGGQRIFDLLDEKPEVDEGKVMLVNAKRLPDDSVTETKERTNLWAWKRVNADGSADYRELKGDIVFKDVDFGYDPGNFSLNILRFSSEFLNEFITNLCLLTKTVAVISRADCCIGTVCHRCYDLAQRFLTDISGHINAGAAGLSGLIRRDITVFPDCHQFPQQLRVGMDAYSDKDACCLQIFFRFCLHIFDTQLFHHVLATDLCNHMVIENLHIRETL